MPMKIDRTFWQRVIIIAITGANVLMFYYTCSKRTGAPQPPVVKELSTPVPTPKATVQPTQVPVPDGQQVHAGQAPLAIIRFESSNLALTPQAQADLVNVFNMMSQKPSMKVEVGGHTDNVGDPVVNLKLSVDRARFVRNYLVKLGIPPDRIIVQGYGSTRPLVENGTPEGRAQNRRVEVIMLNG
jgi:OmpA-OmpF porin, OOP family